MEMKKWLIVVTQDQYDWIKQTAKDTGLKGSHIIGALVSNCMETSAKEFKTALAETQLKIQLQNAQRKRDEADTQFREIQKKLKEKVYA